MDNGYNYFGEICLVFAAIHSASPSTVITSDQVQYYERRKKNKKKIDAAAIEMENILFIYAYTMHNAHHPYVIVTKCRAREYHEKEVERERGAKVQQSPTGYFI